MTTREPQCKDPEIRNAIRNLKKITKEKEKYKKISEIRKNVDRVFHHAIEGQEKFKNHEFFTRKSKVETKTKKPSKSSSSSNGKFVNKGIDDSQREPFAQDEMEYLDGIINDIKSVNKLDYDCLRYLVCQIYLNDLKKIKDGKLKSKIHDEYSRKGIRAKADLLSEMRTSLFTNDQIDYINGLLQGVFSTTEKDNKGDIKHSEIDYVLVVMFTETTIRIVKHVHKLKTNKQAQDFIIKSADDSLTDCE